MTIYLVGGQTIELKNMPHTVFEKQFKQIFENPSSNEFVEFAGHIIRICHISGFYS